MAPVTINGNIVDFDKSHPSTEPFSPDASAADSNYILIKTNDSLNRQEKAELQELGAVLQEYVADNLYLYQYKPTELAPIRDKSFVAGAGIYSKNLKANADLKTVSSVAPEDTRTINVVLHEDKDKAPRDLVPELARAAGVAEDQITVDGNQAKLEVKPDKIGSLAAVDSVRTLEDVPKRVLFNNYARQVLDADVVVNNTPYQGAGQVVAVADTGLDKGSVQDVHPAFTNRVKALIPVGRSSKTNDTHGHGTHVCGSVLGAGIANSQQGSLGGVAPKAQLVLQSLLNDGGGLFPNGAFSLGDLFTEPYKKHGACIHSNSWGSQWSADRNQLPYDDQAKVIDDAVRQNPELLIVFAAGNDGAEQRTPTLGSQAAAKNALTVGATESTRASFGYKVNTTAKSANDATQVAPYSSRGPTKEQRIKPDVLAPGTVILSTKSRDAPTSTSFGVSPDPLYFYDTGTSMATPLVSGCAAVLREVLTKNGVQKPTAALMKALLINGAYTFHHAHSGNEGFGRVNLKNSIIIPNASPNAGFVQGTPFNDRGQSKSITVNVPTRASTGNTQPADPLRVSPPTGKGMTLKATLAYTDTPGEKLQNNLNLVVTAADGSRRNGNMGTAEALDQTNNVEQVVWRGIPTGTAQITVSVARLTSDTQDYALVWRVIPTED